MLKLKYQTKYQKEVGCDEAGRGCLAGPVVAAAVLLPDNFKSKEIQDSKILSEKKRVLLAEIIKEESISYGIGIVDNEEIDKINILNASILAMHRAIDALNIVPDYLIIDGNRFKDYKSIPHSTIVKGDSKFLSIAAASILAKTHRDDLMKKYHEEYPEYLFIKNKGYPSKYHREKVIEIGTCDIHRKTFKLKELNKPLSLFD